MIPAFEVASPPSLAKPIPVAAWVVSPSQAKSSAASAVSEPAPLEMAHFSKLPQSGFLDFGTEEPSASLEVDDARLRNHVSANVISAAPVGYAERPQPVPAAQPRSSRDLAPYSQHVLVPVAESEADDDDEERMGARIVFYAVPEAIHKRLCVWGFGISVLVAFVSQAGVTSTFFLVVAIYGTIGWIMQARRAAAM